MALYSAETAALEPRVRLAITDAQLRLEGEKANLNSRINSIDKKVKAMLAGAQMVAQQAAASLNALHAQATISGIDSTSS